jgi:sporadic carbohydrate cluster 2OG-Fe(II) oxygenase
MKLAEQFTNNGYVIFDIENQKNYEKLKKTISKAIGSTKSLDEFHQEKFFKLSHINNLRLNAYKELNKIKDWENLYYSLAESALKELIGLDISIQNKLNFSIQAPNDKNSVLMLHTDTLSGQTEFEVVLWVPFTESYQTNSMYIYNRKTTEKIFKKLAQNEKKGMQGLFKLYEKDAKFLKLSPGQAMIFSPSLFHGNTLNKTSTTRMSINCRFKSSFSPEFEQFPTERNTGAFYRPLRLSPLSEWAYKYYEGDILFK